jgi:hypothetical protein
LGKWTLSKIFHKENLLVGISIPVLFITQNLFYKYKEVLHIVTFAREQRRFLLIASKAAKPTETELATLLKPTADVIGEIQNFRQVQTSIILSLSQCFGSVSI